MVLFSFMISQKARIVNYSTRFASELELDIFNFGIYCCADDEESGLGFKARRLGVDRDGYPDTQTHI